MADGTPGLTAAVAARLRAAGCVFAEDEARLLIEAAATPAELDVLVERRGTGVPLEHVVGWAEFCGLRIAVDPGVFVPRRRTEFLVRRALLLAGQDTVPAGQDTVPAGQAAVPAGQPTATAGERSGPGGAPPVRVVVDLCCGSGAVGAALTYGLRAGGLRADGLRADGLRAGGPRADGLRADGVPAVELHAADIDPAAVTCARRNLAAAGGRVYLGDLYQPLPPGLRGQVAILAAHMPYMPAGEVRLLPAEARLHEARVAVDGGADGLDVLRRVADGAPAWLKPGGHLLVETSERQAAPAAAAFAAAGLAPRIASAEDLGSCVIIGTRPAAGGLF